VKNERTLADVLQDLDERAVEVIAMLQKSPAHSSSVHQDHAKIVGLLNAVADLRVALRSN
jgi:hypothetical protein